MIDWSLSLLFDHGEGEESTYLSVSRLDHATSMNYKDRYRIYVSLYRYNIHTIHELVIGDERPIVDYDATFMLPCQIRFNHNSRSTVARKNYIDDFFFIRWKITPLTEFRCSDDYTSRWQLWDETIGTLTRPMGWSARFIENVEEKRKVTRCDANFISIL